MPFVTEEIYQMYNEGSITVSEWPVINEEFSFSESEQIELIYDIITTIRNVRAEKNVPNSRQIDLELQVHTKEELDFINNHLNYLQRFTNYENILVTTEEVDTTKKIVNVLSNAVVLVPLHQLVDLNEELKKLEDQVKKLKSEIERCNKMLGNPNFVNKAPKEKVELEKTKLADYERQLEEVYKLIEDYK